MGTKPEEQERASEWAKAAIEQGADASATVSIASISVSESSGYLWYEQWPESYVKKNCPGCKSIMVGLEGVGPNAGDEVRSPTANDAAARAKMKDLGIAYESGGKLLRTYGMGALPAYKAFFEWCVEKENKAGLHSFGIGPTGLNLNQCKILRTSTLTLCKDWDDLWTYYTVRTEKQAIDILKGQFVDMSWRGGKWPYDDESESNVLKWLWYYQVGGGNNSYAVTYYNNYYKVNYAAVKKLLQQKGSIK